jgi:ACS family sodium-dependent inorganic phosphate cotransporter
MLQQKIIWCYFLALLSVAQSFQTSSSNFVKKSSFTKSLLSNNCSTLPIHKRGHSHCIHQKISNIALYSQPRTKDATGANKLDEDSSEIDAPLVTPSQSEEESSEEEEKELEFSEFAPILILCWFVALLSALDRVAMSVAILPISTEFHLTDTAKGSISSVFSVGYGLGIIPAGLLVSAVSPRIIMASGVVLWSLATFGTPIAANLIQMVQYGDVMTNEDMSTSVVCIAQNTLPLLLIRSVMGAAESVVLPTIQRILANWVPASKKSLSVATVYSGFQIGTVCAYLLSPTVMEGFGWRGLFYIYGVVGALWLIPWWIFAKDGPESSTMKTIEGKAENASYLVVEQRLVDNNGEEAVGVFGSQVTTWEEAADVFKDAPWKAMLTSKATWGMTIAHAANNWGLYNNLSWAPTFYAEQYGLNVKESAFLSVLPSIAGAIFGLIAGYAADKVIEGFTEDENVEKRTLVRKTFQGMALLGPAACLLTLAYHIPESPVTAQFLLTGAVGLQAFNSAGYSSAPQEKAGDQWSGLLYSITSLPGVVFGSVGVYVTGQILDATNQNWSGVFGLNAAVDVVGGLAFIALYNSRKEFD